MYTIFTIEIGYQTEKTMGISYEYLYFKIKVFFFFQKSHRKKKKNFMMIYNQHAFTFEPHSKSKFLYLLKLMVTHVFDSTTTFGTPYLIEINMYVNSNVYNDKNTGNNINIYQLTRYVYKLEYICTINYNTVVTSHIWSLST